MLNTVPALGQKPGTLYPPGYGSNEKHSKIGTWGGEMADWVKSMIWLKRTRSSELKCANTHAHTQIYINVHIHLYIYIMKSHIHT